MNLFPYNPKSIICTWGENLIQGFADGSMVVVEYDEDAVTKTAGTQGDVTATINQNRAGKATFNIKQGAALNDVLSRACAQNQPRLSRLIVKPLTIKDLFGTTLCIAPQAWVEKVAKTEFAKDHTPREWVIAFGELKMLTGGAVL